MPSITTWTRLEPRARSGDMRPGLEARVFDPLWLLGRQWQVGEFQGEDAGSPLYARVRAEVASLTAVRAPGGTAQTYDAAVPLEAVVEQEQASAVDLRTAAEAGLHFLRLLSAEGMAAYRAPFRDAFRLTVPPATLAGMDAQSRRYLQIMAGRVPDGLALAAALGRGLPANPPVAAADRPQVRAAADRFLRWIDDLVEVAPPGPSSWQRDRFEYRFEVGAGSAVGPAGKVVLAAPEYQGGHLDWHSFVHDTGSDLPAATQTHVVTATTLPVRASYAGMPAARYWQLEDSRVDFGGVEAAPTDLARMIVLDFATIYGNDWYVVPLELPVGTVTTVRSLVVGDTFADQWLVSRVSDPGWAMYELTAVGPGAAAAGHRLGRLFLPPALPATIEGDPVEDVVLLRDEGANVAWAVERTVEGAAGARVDRVEAWHEQRRWGGGGPIHAGAPVQIAPLAYRLASEVPEHWIPLVPEDAAPGTTNLRVSALERPGKGGAPPMPILPLGRLLEPGTELLIPEEEVPAEGARLTRAWQYARWLRGSVHVWSARRKQAGRGVGASGLAFDVVEPWRLPATALAYEVVDLRVTVSALSDEVAHLDRLAPGRPVVVRWRVRNTGTETWRRTGADALFLGTTDARDHPGRLATPTWVSSTRPASPAESSIEPDQVATFVFEIQPPSGTQPFEEAFDLVTAGRWFDGPRLVLRGQVFVPTPPSISGTPRVGAQLTASPGMWPGAPPFTYAYQWRRCDASGGACVDIAGATGATSTVAPADVGFTLRVAVTATNAAGSASAVSDRTAVVSAVPPANTSPPAIFGAPGVGLTLQASTGTWTGAPPPTFTYQWRRCDATGGACVDIPGATGPRYVLTSADQGRTVRVVVTATNPGGAVGATSSPTAVVVVPPANTAPASIMGTAEAGATLTANPGTWSGTSPTISYRWRRCDASEGACVDIAGASGRTYVVAQGDVGFTIRMLVTASNAGGVASSLTANTPVVAPARPPANTSQPTVAGNAFVGETLTAQEGTWSGSAPIGFAYQWQRCDSAGACTNIAGATAKTYRIAAADERYRLRVIITATNLAGSASATSPMTPGVATVTPPTNLSPPTISGEFRTGALLTADPGKWSGEALTFGYQWLRCDAQGQFCVPISGETSPTYVPRGGEMVPMSTIGPELPDDKGRRPRRHLRPGGGDVGSTLRVQVTATSPAGSRSAQSPPTPVIQSSGKPTDPEM